MAIRSDNMPESNGDSSVGKCLLHVLQRAQAAKQAPEHLQVARC